MAALTRHGMREFAAVAAAEERTLNGHSSETIIEITMDGTVMKMAQGTLTRLSNIGNGRVDAFYNVFRVDQRMVTGHGKRGHAGRYNIEGLGNANTATDACERKVTEKRNKGYSVDSVEHFEFDADEFNRILQADGQNAAGEWLSRQSLRSRAKSGVKPTFPKPDATPEPAAPADPLGLSTPVATLTGANPFEVLESRIKAAMTLAATAVEPADTAKVVQAYTIAFADVEGYREHLSRLSDYLEALESLMTY